MVNNKLVTSIFELHISIFSHALKHNIHKEIEVPLLTFRAPGHIDWDYIKAFNLNLDYNLFPDEVKSKFISVFSTGLVSSTYPLQSEGMTKGCIDSFLESVRHTYLRAVVSNPLNHYESFLRESLNESKSIANWIEHGTTYKSIVIDIQSEINMGSYSNFGKWELNKLGQVDKSIEVYSRWQSTQEALEGVNSSIYFKRKMESMPESPEEILLEIDILTLSLWLSIGYLYRTQQVKFESFPWKFSPEKKAPLGFEPTQIWWEDSREHFSLQSWANINNTIKGLHYFPPADPLPKEIYERIIGWIAILSENKKAVYGLNMICDGFRDIARSVNQQSFRKNRIARDGIFRIISGIEGLNSDCKPIGKKGNKLDVAKTFVDCWSVIWEKILMDDPTNRILSKVPNIEYALHDIYSLRSDLAHSDPISLALSLQKVQNSCVGLLGGSQIEPPYVGLTILSIARELLEYLFKEPAVLKELLRGNKPSHS